MYSSLNPIEMNSLAWESTHILHSFCIFHKMCFVTKRSAHSQYYLCSHSVWISKYILKQSDKSTFHTHLNLGWHSSQQSQLGITSVTVENRLVEF